MSRMPELLKPGSRPWKRALWGIFFSAAVDEAFIRNYIRHPNVDVVKGFPPIMPHVELTDAELDAIVKYLATLKG
jgi:cytochrome c1